MFFPFFFVMQSRITVASLNHQKNFPLSSQLFHSPATHCCPFLPEHQNQMLNTAGTTLTNQMMSIDLSGWEMSKCSLLAAVIKWAWIVCWLSFVTAKDIVSCKSLGMWDIAAFWLWWKKLACFVSDKQIKIIFIFSAHDQFVTGFQSWNSLDHSRENAHCY